MWVFKNCQETNDRKLERCSKYNIPKDCTEYLVVQNYTPDTDVSDDQLTVSIGDLITVIEKKEEIWRGKMGKQEGWFPKTCVTENMSRREKYKVITPYSDVHLDHLKVDEDDVVTVINRKNNGLMWVQFDGHEGWIPEKHLAIAITDKVIVKPKIAPKPIKPDKGSRKENITSAFHSHSLFKKYTVLYDHKKDDTKCLAIEKGDIVSIIGQEQNGWFLGKIGNEKGFVPAEYVHLLENQDDEFYCVTALCSEEEECTDLRLEVGDIVKVVNKRNSGWFWLKHDQTEGWYPENHLKKHDATSGSSLHLQTRTGFKPLTDEYINIENDLTYDNPPVVPIRSMKKQQNGEYMQTPTESSCGNHIEQSYGDMKALPSQAPAWKQKAASYMRNDSYDHSQNICENVTYVNDRITSDPPPVPGRRTLRPQQAQNEFQDLKQNTYGNTDLSYERKKDSPEALEYEVPNTNRRTNDTDEEKLDETYHTYDYIQENYVKYTEPLSKNKRQPAEHTITERPELPKRPPPPSRPPMPKPEDTARIRHDEDTVHMGNLYGRREAGELRLVMVGRTGSGKSATGNTIMAKNDHFESKLAGESVTRECKRGECSQSGRKLVVVDTPGLFDTQVPFEQISKEIIRCVNMSTPGPHAFLLVIQIARFTDEEIETLNRLFDLFGENMGRFAIIAFTKLDDLEREETTIENYIEMAPKKMKEFLQRCQGRYIAFDNKASEKKKMTKVKSLIQLVDDIGNKNGGKYYTNAMYKEAEAALQRKIKVLEEEKALEKKKEIERIESTFVQKIDSINQENKKLSKQVSSNEVLQRQVQRDKEKALQEIQKMKDEIKKIDKKRNEAMYRVKKQEKQEKEKQAKALEEKEKRNMQIIQDMHQQQMEMNRRYQEMERQKETQLSKASEDHNKRMEAEIQRIVDGSNQKHNDMMKALDAKEKANEKLQEQMTKQNTSIQEMMRDKDKQQDEHNKRLAEEKDRANEYLRRQLDEQKKSMDASKEAILQEQRERDKRQREEFNEATARSHEKMQEQMAQQNASMQTLVLERDKEILKQQEAHNKRIEEEKARAENTLNVQLADQEKSLNAKTEALLEERRRDKIQRQKDQDALYKINDKILKQNEAMQDLLHEREREKKELEEKYRKKIEDEKLKAKESARKQQEEQKRFMEATKEAILQEQRERDKRQREEFNKKTEEILRQQRERERRQQEENEELKRQKAQLEEEYNNSGCILS